MSNADALRKRDDNDDEPEDHLWEGGYSGKAMIGSWIVAGILSIAAIGAGAMFAGVGIAVGLGVAVLIWAVLGFQMMVRKLGVAYELTTQRFIHKSGILSRTTDRIELIDIDDVTFMQGIVQRMVNVGTIRVTSSDRSHPELVLLGIDNVEHVANTIDDARRKERRRRGLHIEAI